MFLRNVHAVPSAALVVASLLVAVCASAPASAALAFRPSEFIESAAVNVFPPVGSSSAAGIDNAAPEKVTFQPVFDDNLSIDAVVSTSGGRRPLATATASMSGAGPEIVILTAFSTIKYFFGVEGPAGSQVPILASMQSTVEASGLCCNDAAGAETIVSITDRGSFIFRKAISASRVSGPPADAYDITTGFFIEPNRIYTVELRALVSVRSEFGAAFASAEVDPLIVIDPGFAGIDQYSLQFSAFAVPEPVPLPATAPLLLGALGIGAGLARRRP